MRYLTFLLVTLIWGTTVYVVDYGLYGEVLGI
jgi:hypothetical protein